VPFGAAESEGSTCSCTAESKGTRLCALRRTGRQQRQHSPQHTVYSLLAGWPQTHSLGHTAVLQYCGSHHKLTRVSTRRTYRYLRRQVVRPLPPRARPPRHWLRAPSRPPLRAPRAALQRCPLRRTHGECRGTAQWYYLEAVLSSVLYSTKQSADVLSDSTKGTAQLSPWLF
jgi:hypothetical protein